MRLALTLFTAAVAVGGWAVSGCAAESAVAFEQEIAAWRAERVAKLTKPDGWLTLIGLHFLQTGPNRVGTAKNNDVVLSHGPAHLGVVTVAAGGKVSLDAAPDADVRIDGQLARHGDLKWDVPSKPSVITTGTVTLIVIDRAGKKALRVKDSEAAARTRFAGLEYFLLDPAWRIEARWQPFEKLRMMPVVNILGQTEPTLVAGKAVFERDDHKVELLAIDEGLDVPLFFVISDLTSGKETYGGGRHLYVARPGVGAGRIMLDFNRAENPPCAFTPFSTCPVPPKENRLPFALRVGEKTYRGMAE
jgi:uncharacterized protein